MNKTLDTATADAWYRHFWPWLLMIVPLTSVVVGIAMISLALFFPDDVVVDTYYRDGQGINQLQDLDHAARALGLQATLSYDAASAVTHIHFSGTDEEFLQLAIFHVTDSQQDRSVQFVARGNGDYSSTEAFLTPLFTDKGVWYLELRGVDNDWRLRKRIASPVSGLEF